MALAQRLNELAASHAQGLLNDDEYRLLRQDVFQRFSDTTIIPVETHYIPIESHVLPVAVNVGEPGYSLQVKRQVEFAPVSLPGDAKHPIHIPAKHYTVTASVASLFRRATGRKPSKETLRSDADAHSSARSIKRALVPHILSRKSSESNSLHSRTESTSSYARSRKTSISDSGFLSPPLSPTKPMHPPREASASKISITAPSSTMGDDIFEDGGLNTTKDIRQAVSDLEHEGRRLIDAFNDFERSTITRVYKDRPNDQRPPLSEMPVSGNWPSTPICPIGASVMNGRSVSGSSTGRSASSSKISLSLPRSNGLSTSTTPAFLHRNRSATMASRPSSSRSGGSSFLKPKSSLSSLTSTSPAETPPASFLSVGRAKGALRRKGSSSSLASAPNAPSSSLTRSVSMNRSTGHLPSNVRSNMRRPSISESASEGGGGGEGEIDPEVLDVRKRRIEVIGRYEARLEYLRARLKGAELHEKLLKR
ncbi:hypothetical protein V5O48_009757 [Marasmius crinis-equi]|uniref:Uncharacterized protein n=1 Tax=Marasmius crinis-equi TaxID=585013 RepID=A0ABR3FAA8_9AGAR